jgi:predicted peptidase
MRALYTGILLWMATMMAPRSALAANVADFTDFSLRNASNQVLLPGRLYVPPEASHLNSPRPFIVFLHGGGESGSNNLSQINVNIDNLLVEAKRRGAFLYAPQTPNAWSDLTLTNRVMNMVDRAIAEQSVDADRLYITGLSNGGGGTWNMLSRFPERFSAGLPICGVNPASDFVPSRLVDQSILAVHARNDTVVSVGTTRNAINRILAAAGQPPPTYPTASDAPLFEYSSPVNDLTYLEPPLGGHAVWPFVYNTPAVYDWLFAHTTAVPEPNASIVLAPIVLAIFSQRQRRVR